MKRLKSRDVRTRAPNVRKERTKAGHPKPRPKIEKLKEDKM